jgi:hypothetical protein
MQQSRFVAASPGFHLVLWEDNVTQKEMLANPTNAIDGPVVVWRFDHWQGPPKPLTPQGDALAGVDGLYAILSSDDRSVFWPEIGKRFASLESWLSDPEVSATHRERYPPPPPPPRLVPGA